MYSGISTNKAGGGENHAAAPICSPLGDVKKCRIEIVMSAPIGVSPIERRRLNEMPVRAARARGAGPAKYLPILRRRRHAPANVSIVRKAKISIAKSARREAAAARNNQHGASMAEMCRVPGISASSPSREQKADSSPAISSPAEM